MEGWVLFLVALVLLVVFHQVVNRIYYAINRSKGTPADAV